MFSNLGLHVTRFPTGTYGYVGSVPAALATFVPATDADVRAGRAHKVPGGPIVVPKFPTFPTAAEAVAFAAGLGFEAKLPVSGLTALEAAMAAGVTFGTLAVGAAFHFPGRPETVYVKVSPRRFKHRPDAVTGGTATFTTGAKTAVVGA